MSEWPTSSISLARAQQALAKANPPEWPVPTDMTIGGCFICFGRSGTVEHAWAVAAIVRGRQIIVGDPVGATVDTPYEPGLLGLREGPLLEAAVRALPHPLDVLLVNATGRDHPRGAGLALHLGALLDLPTVGVTDRPLVAVASGSPAEKRGSSAPISYGDELVGYLLRTRPGARPVVVHAAWRTTPEAAVEVVMRAASRARTPEPLRQARHAARMARAASLTKA